jgi:hypothetical protein
LRLLVEGGGDDLPAAAVELFCKWCREYRAGPLKILVIPWASSRDPSEILADYGSHRWFGREACEVILAASREKISEDTENWCGLKEIVQGCSGGFAYCLFTSNERK